MRILVVDGIGTVGTSSGVVDRVAEHLAVLLSDRLSGPPEWVRWPAAMAGVGGRSTWTAGARAGLTDLTRRVAADDDELVLLAYSGGNRIVHEFLERAAAESPSRLDRVRAVGLISDPYRPRGRRQRGRPDPGGWGLCGELEGPIPERTVWSAVPGDAITAAEADSLLRTVADLAANVPGGLWRDVREVLLAGRFQLSWQVDRARADPLGWAGQLGRRTARAGRDVRRYFGGWHTTHYTRRAGGGPGLAERLAWELAEVAVAAGSAQPAAAMAPSTASVSSGRQTTRSGR